MILPASLISSLENAKGFDKDAFIQTHQEPALVTSVRVNPAKPFGIGNFNTTSAPVPWSKYGCYLERRPSFTFDPLFHAGCYYVQEASSMFLEEALKQTTDLSQSLKILDLAAAPGGKSTHIQSLMSPNSLLVSNEVIRSRANILKDNIVKWGGDNVVITNNDPRDFSRLENYFDVVVVDAPCSGSGLFRRDEEAISEWSEGNVQLCSRRQQRILSDVWPSVKPGGVLIYSTCSYSTEEDENIVSWMESQLEAEPQRLTLKQEWNVVETEAGYRFWPDRLRGEGFFIGCVRKNGNISEKRRPNVKKLAKLTSKEKEVAAVWVAEKGNEMVKSENLIIVAPVQILNEIELLQKTLQVEYFGVLAGEMIRDKLIPNHALAMSGLASDDVERLALERVEAVHYLQKKDIRLSTDTKGWKLVTYQQYSLGWVNILPNRINNYYPRELRILKDI